MPRARSSPMPWMASASGGIGTPGSSSQLAAPCRRLPTVSTRAAVTIRDSAGSVPVVSRSKPTSGSCHQLIGVCPSVRPL